MEISRYRMSNTTIYRGNSNNKGNRNGKVFVITFEFAVTILTMKLFSLWH